VLLDGHEVIACFTAHPDDEAGVSGTLARLADRGHPVHLVVATDGSRGSPGLGLTRDQLAARRRQEMTDAAAVLGLAEVHWLGLADGEAALSDQLRPLLFRALRRLRPDVVLCMDPWRADEPHPDHRAVAMAAFEAAYLADGPAYFPEQLADGISPHHARAVYFFHTDRPDVEVSVEAVLERKARSLACHASQLPAGTDWQALLPRFRNTRRMGGPAVEGLHRVGFSQLDLGLD
jgi:LmbE family N-acetylglucosaminyl deacetylase